MILRWYSAIVLDGRRSSTNSNNNNGASSISMPLGVVAGTARVTLDDPKEWNGWMPPAVLLLPVVDCVTEGHT